LDGYNASTGINLVKNLEKWLDEISIGSALDLGAGEGETSLWLAQHDFKVDAVERDALIYERLSAACAGTTVNPHLSDLTEFSLSPNSYSLIVAQAVLHFLRPTQLWPLADRLVDALVPGGILLAEVFTTDDPGYTALRQSNTLEIEPNTFEAPPPIGLIHYFTPGELRRVFAALEVLENDESRRADPQSVDGFRAGAYLLARRPQTSLIVG
jgi:SAM-dependent methyltransferase